MQTLEKLLSRFAKGTDARWWIGKRPDARDGQLAKIIAGQVGLPTSTDDPFARDGMVRLDRANAARVLAVAGTTSLAYTETSPRSGALMEAKSALNDLHEDATFLSNGHWQEGGSRSWNPLTTATFDCGLIGFDGEHAFIFWIEEED
ncbi:hypothetical protein [Sphingomonas sp. ERG5]|uniref:hypothetical protein n=1 Tax=Sphingomonas sp. ERG5 TaxID=1381597 RepID=UPI00054BE354|nr:hypothetical protein [Sphingomonas sp. ERG5]